MKNSILRTLSMIGLVAALSVATVSAQPPMRIEANIPFDFIVGEKTLPAGQYTIRNAGRHLQNAILIQSADRGESAIIITIPVEGRTSQKSARLVFHQYGDSHFLAQIWSPGTETGREIKASNTEQHFVRSMVRAVKTVEAVK